MRIVKGFSNYTISEDGCVVNVTTGKVCKPFTSRNIMSVTVTNDLGSRLTKSVNNLLKINYPEKFQPTLVDCITTHEVGDLSKALLEVSDEVKELREEFTYNFETGEVIRKTGGSGWVEQEGYVVHSWKSKEIKAHKLIFLLVLGYIPEGQVDHINHNRSDNRWLNLRVVCKNSNARNLSKYVSNTSGTMGVSWHKKQQKWVARIMVNGKSVQLGSFIDKEEAIKARKEAVQKYNFHENHGDVK